jgi:hypothetical protein
VVPGLYLVLHITIRIEVKEDAEIVVLGKLFSDAVF